MGNREVALARHGDQDRVLRRSWREILDDADLADGELLTPKPDAAARPGKALVQLPIFFGELIATSLGKLHLSPEMALLVIIAIIIAVLVVPTYY